MGASKHVLLIFALAAFSACRCDAQKETSNLPDKLVIGEQSFIDMGPPFDFYQIYLLTSEGNTTRATRLTLSPGAGTCMPPTIETAEGIVPKSLSQLLSNKNPCSIPEKALHREAKRCKHCLVFSGAHVTMQVACGNTNRLIRYEVLDRDMFEEHSNTPEQTSKTFELLNRINSVLGNNVMDRPIFSTGEQTPQLSPQSSSDITDLASGKFDRLFMDAPDKPSVLCGSTEAQSSSEYRPE